MIEIEQVGEPRVLDDTSVVQEHYIFSAHMSTMWARFYNYYEVSYGNPVWQLKVFGDRRLEEDVTPLWQGLEEHDHCFQLPLCYVPFGHNGYTFCYDLVQSGTHIYDFAENTRKEAEVKGIWSILAAPSTPNILIGGTREAGHQDGVYLIDYSGKIIRNFEALEATPDAFLSWLMYKPTILAISKKAKKHKTWLSEIHPETGEVLQKRSFDPQDILPYDDLSYSQHLGEGGYLKVSDGRVPDGLHWNKWHSYIYDFGYKRLRAKIYHPPIELLQSERSLRTDEVIGLLYEYTFRIEFV